MSTAPSSEASAPAPNTAYEQQWHLAAGSGQTFRPPTAGFIIGKVTWTQAESGALLTGQLDLSSTWAGSVKALVMMQAMVAVRYRRLIIKPLPGPARAAATIEVTVCAYPSSVAAPRTLNEMLAWPVKRWTFSPMIASEDASYEVDLSGFNPLLKPAPFSGPQVAIACHVVAAKLANATPQGDAVLFQALADFEGSGFVQMGLTADAAGSVPAMLP